MKLVRCCPRSCREKCPYAWAEIHRGRFKRCIEPRPRIPIGQQVEAKEAVRFEKLHGQVDFSCRNFSSNMAISAVQIVPGGVLPGADKCLDSEVLLERS